MSRARKPVPVHVSTVCSVCGLDWDKHPDDPSAYDCVELLKAEVKKPHPVTYPAYPYYPYWYWRPQPEIEKPFKWTWGKAVEPMQIEKTITFGKTS